MAPQMLTDRRYATLAVAIRKWLDDSQLTPDPEALLEHDYLSLCLRAWPESSGDRLTLATQWALWTWIMDDHLDTGRFDSSSGQFDQVMLNAFTGAVYQALDGLSPADGATHPAVTALGPLVEATRAAMPADWWRRYERDVHVWLHSAAIKRVRFLQPARTPGLRDYQTIRPADGGMMMASGWCELATSCVTTERHVPLLQSLLASFSTVGYLANDLAAGPDDVFTVVNALAKTERLKLPRARARATGLLAAELERWTYLCGAVTDTPGDDFRMTPGFVTSTSGATLSVDTARFARTHDRFLRALVEWTASSSRYAPTPADAGSGQRELCPEESR